MSESELAMLLEAAKPLIELAIAEDIGPGDATSEATMRGETALCARIVAKEARRREKHLLLRLEDRLKELQSQGLMSGGPGTGKSKEQPDETLVAQPMVETVAEAANSD